MTPEDQYQMIAKLGVLEGAKAGAFVSKGSGASLVATLPVKTADRYFSLEFPNPRGKIVPFQFVVSNPVEGVMYTFEVRILTPSTVMVHIIGDKLDFSSSPPLDILVDVYALA